MTLTILILNGPNLNTLGTREPEIYGYDTLADIEARCKTLASDLGWNIVFKQSNHEGELVTWIGEARGKVEGIIINAAALTHTSVALRDALKLHSVPIVEVHISNIFAREAFRHHSYISDIAKAVICGCGPKGYELALLALDEWLK